MKKSMISLLLLLLLVGCAGKEERQMKRHPLESWNAGENKDAILSYIAEVTDPSSDRFIDERLRVAAFEIDGTLLCEKPYNAEVAFAMYQIQKMAPDHPEWENEEPYASAIAGDIQGLAKNGVHGLVVLMMAIYDGRGITEMEAEIEDWVKKSKHPEYGVPYSDLAYKPMLELMRYLELNGFKIFLYTAEERQFCRAWSNLAFQIPRNRVMGSEIKTEVVVEEGRKRVVFLPEVEFYNINEALPVTFGKAVGRRPVICVGNSDMDLDMMEWTASNAEPSLNILIHHTDAEREYAYDKDVRFGKLEEGLKKKGQKGWLVVDMKKDWKELYASELKRP